MIHEETEKILRMIAENNNILKEVLQKNEELICIAGAMRMSYTEALKNNDWKGYQTLKELKTKTIAELYTIQKRSVLNCQSFTEQTKIN